jgi:hypothetical protein
MSQSALAYQNQVCPSHDFHFQANSFHNHQYNANNINGQIYPNANHMPERQNSGLSTACNPIKLGVGNVMQRPDGLNSAPMEAIMPASNGLPVALDPCPAHPANMPDHSSDRDLYMDEYFNKFDEMQDEFWCGDQRHSDLSGHTGHLFDPVFDKNKNTKAKKKKLTDANLSGHDSDDEFNSADSGPPCFDNPGAHSSHGDLKHVDNKSKEAKDTKRKANLWQLMMESGNGSSLVSGETISLDECPSIAQPQSGLARLKNSVEHKATKKVVDFEDEDDIGAAFDSAPLQRPFIDLSEAPPSAKAADVDCDFVDIADFEKSMKAKRRAANLKKNAEIIARKKAEQQATDTEKKLTEPSSASGSGSSTKASSASSKRKNKDTDAEIIL